MGGERVGVVGGRGWEGAHVVELRLELSDRVVGPHKIVRGGRK